MSKYLAPSLTTLPIEIVYQIFDSLDAQTILSSVRGTCRRLKSLASSYDKFVLDFIRIRKPEFELICRLIDPRQVITLILCHEDETLFQTDLFISYFHNKYFSRLRSLTLLHIDERHFKFILKCININSLNSFSLVIKKADERYKKSTAVLLSSIISQKNLRRLEFEIPPRLIPSSTWSVQCMIQHLRISACTTFCPCTILQCSPMLQTISVNFETSKKDHIVLADAWKTPFTQLHSLTLENLSTKIEVLESLLLLIPSLTNFKMIGIGNFFDGNRWEQFIQANLPFLNKFEFYLERTADADYNRTDVELIIASFRTPFWLEYKKWFVTCEYKINLPRSILLYSIPICVSSMVYQSESTIISLSTFDVKGDNNVSIMDNIKTIRLDFSKILLNDTPNQVIMNVDVQIFFCSILFIQLVKYDIA
ncbi:unnamed protein product [Rotaria sp. Silwood2]|nr:unnamed protein product [Rotaria sp. Silwood2]CAF2832754.1 unnamed protein product [Rotaria sp. Silwood2]CAF3340730.1 unnamed protein product [Rotaria sp. Silwood2]CAF3400489.1 unnamed protein product [Rotaria sp. Silwood2]CAF4359370.1 unnamed protein product [Rotaria sp. Silwood2]